MARYKIMQKVKTATGYDILNPYTPFDVIQCGYSISGTVITLTPNLPQENFDTSQGLVVCFGGNTVLAVAPTAISVYGTSYTVTAECAEYLQFLSLGNSRKVFLVLDSTSGIASSVGQYATQARLALRANNMNVSGLEGILPADKGGTGLTSLQATRNAMGLGNTLGVLPLANGGTGTNSAAGAKGTLGFATKVRYTGTIGTGWSGSGPYTQTLSIGGITAGDTPVVDIVLSGTAATDRSRLESWGMVGRIVTNNGSITITCYDDKPTVAMPIALLCVR